MFTPPEYDLMFGINPDYGREAAGGARFIIDELGAKKTAIAYLNSEAGEPAAEAFPAYIEANGGQVVASEAIASTNIDYTAQAQKLKSSGATVVYSFLLDTGLAALQKAADSIGYDPIWVSWFPAFTPSYMELAGDLAEGTYVSQFATPLTETSDPGVSEYLEVMEPACSDYVTSQAAQSASSFAAAIVEGVRVSTEGDKELDREAFAAAIEGTDQPFGLTPSVTWMTPRTPVPPSPRCTRSRAGSSRSRLSTNCCRRRNDGPERRSQTPRTGARTQGGLHACLGRRSPRGLGAALRTLAGTSPGAGARPRGRADAQPAIRGH